MKTQIRHPSPPQSLKERRIHAAEHRFQDRCRINPALRMARIGRRGVPSVLALAALLASSAPCWLPGQTFTVIHSFSPTTNYPQRNSDGEQPYCSLILSGNVLYGTTHVGGTYGVGTVFKVNTDGTGATTLYDFDGGPAGGSDGAYPIAGLLLSGNTLYGTTMNGGSSCCDGYGTVFEVNTDGTGFATLYSFSAATYPGYMNADGAVPQHCQLVMSGGALYGTTRLGGSSGNGTVFAFDLAGGGLTTLNAFSGGAGAQPIAGLVLATNGYTLYGTTRGGGPGGSGTVFAINTDGTGFTNLYSFTSLHSITNSNGVVSYTNSDGGVPAAGLILSSQTLYGTTQEGGSFGQGTVFALNSDGTGFSVLHSFTGGSDGANGCGDCGFGSGLALSGSTLYGTTGGGGSSGNGTVFAVNTDGTGFITLHSFSTNPSDTNSDGTAPQGGLVLSGNTLYGAAVYGGSAGNGTIFSITFSPQLTITPSTTGVVLTWPTNYAGFDYTGYALQSTTNLASPVWTVVSPVPVVINGQNTVTKPISGTQQFFRLAQ